jgi:2-oxoglutarate ferredoxin oxidoreductase subunit beta
MTAPATQVQKTNRLGLTRSDYLGADSTLCPGCGNLSIIHQLISACFELSIPPEAMIKVSGIGCSSKAPAYFLSRSHGFNGLHGRMPSVATGAVLANPALRVVGLSGDGDTASIGIGQFKYAVFRNVPMVYIMANNGVYGLTKGQVSATAQRKMPDGAWGEPSLPPMDMCLEAVASEATFVARSFSGNTRQLHALLKAALTHHGMAFLDVVSPCITFNNREETRMSFDWAKKNEEPLQDLEYLPAEHDAQAEEAENGRQRIRFHDGSVLSMADRGRHHDPGDRIEALKLLEQSRREDRLLTGLIYINTKMPSFVEICGVDAETPIAGLPEEQLRPSRESLEKINRFFA